MRDPHRLMPGAAVARAALRRARVRTAAGAVAIFLLVGGCSSPAAVPSDATAYNATDVMFLQMQLAQIAEGDQVAALAQARAGDPRIRTIAAELRGRWRDESGTMTRWLVGWQQPTTADASAGAHAGMGDLHALQVSDLAGLRAASGEAFDRTAVSMLLSSLHNCVETTLMESSGGGYPPARHLAESMTDERQAEVRQLLRIAATQ